MKAHLGSIQRKGLRYYLVTKKNGRQKWQALHTSSLPLARRRAAVIAPLDSNHENEWLESLVKIGIEAQEKLNKRSRSVALNWHELSRIATAGGGISPDTAATRLRNIRLLRRLMRESAAGQAPLRGAMPDDRPSALTRELALSLAGKIAQQYRSAPRIVGFYARLWRLAGLDETVWAEVPAKPDREGEFYRRLDRAEIRAVVSALNGERDLQDMVVIGYNTGLRLSDVAELERSEIDSGLRFLRLQPNKMRGRKCSILSIPLSDEAAEILARRLEAMALDDQYIFGKEARRRPSRRICAAFHAAGVSSEGNGRASFHSLRATFISMMDEAGIPPHLTDAITGHAPNGMHGRYSQPSARALALAVKRAIPPILQGGSEGNVFSTGKSRVIA